MRTLSIVGAGVAVTLVALVTVLPPATQAVAAPSPQIAPDPGKAIFEGKGGCFACHGMNGEGAPLGPDLTDDDWLHFETRPDVGELKALVKQGVAEPAEYPAPMPPMGGAQLSDEELTALAAYVLSLGEKQY